MSGRLFYVQDTRTKIGNCALFWAKNAAGYTCDLDQAHVYTKEEILGKTWRKTDVPRDKAEVDAAALRHCRSDVALSRVEGVRHER
jgi:hypothetical protein